MLWNPKFDKLAEAKPIERWREVLLDAAELVRKRGLAKFTQQADNGSVCVQGAISIAATGAVFGYGPLYCEATMAVGRILIARGEKVGDEIGYGNADWNNRPERTAQEVIDVLLEAATQ